jgi:REP element-mobilizing transposase RayT
MNSLHYNIFDISIMPRSTTTFESCEYYHVWTHANGAENIFREDENYLFFLSRYTFYLAPVVKTFAYCLMPNHIHLLIQVKENPNISVSKAFSNLLNSYSQSFNKKYDRKGSLFISNLKRKKIDSDSYLTRCITYIHQNPSHHGFVEDFTKWKHSSWKAFFSESQTNLEREKVLDWFGGKDAMVSNHKLSIDIDFDPLEKIDFRG